MSKSDDVARAMAKVAGERSAIERALAPGLAVADIVRAMQLPSHISASLRMAEAMQPPAHLSAVSQMLAAMQREHQLFRSIAGPPRAFEDVMAQIAQMRALSESITKPYQHFQELVKSQSSIFEQMSSQVAALDALKFSVPQFAQAVSTWNVASIGLANRMNDIGLLAQREALSARLFQAPQVYADFVRHTTGLLSDNPSAGIAARLRGSLNLAEHQLLGISDAVSGFMVVPDDAEIPDNVRTLNAPFAQQAELLAGPILEEETDAEAMIAVSPSAQNAKLGHRVLELVTLCNEAGRTSGYKIEIFKPTTRLLTVFNDLPWLVPSERSCFGDALDCLYIIFYEGPGKDKLRFLRQNGGPLTEDDCDLIWRIKHLRNKWLRHDPDHGDEKGIHKSWTELSVAFRWLGLAGFPTEEKHFRQMHHRLLVEAEVFLAHLLDQLKLEP